MTDHPTTSTQVGGYTTWTCLGCQQNGRHPKSCTAAEHASDTGHNVSQTESVVSLVYRADSPPIPAPASEILDAQTLVPVPFAGDPAPNLVLRQPGPVKARELASPADVARQMGVRP